MLGFILSLVGMECTYIGGKEKEKNRAIFIGSLCHATSGTKINFFYYYNFDHDSMFLTNEINDFAALFLFPFFLGLLAAAGYAVYACHITAEFFNPSFELK